MWTVTTFIPSNVDVYYRFYVCVMVENEKPIIKRREVCVTPRVIPKTGEWENQISERIVICTYALQLCGLIVFVLSKQQERDFHDIVSYAGNSTYNFEFGVGLVVCKN